MMTTTTTSVYRIAQLSGHNITLLTALKKKFVFFLYIYAHTHLYYFFCLFFGLPLIAHRTPFNFCAEQNCSKKKKKKKKHIT